MKGPYPISRFFLYKHKKREIFFVCKWRRKEFSFKRMKTLFQKILDGEIPSKIVYKDDVCAAINDINPQAPVHVLLFPIKPIARIAEAKEEDAQILAHLMLAVPKVAEKCGLKDGFRVVINNGLLAGETIPHLHLHILGGRQLHWPPC